MLLTQSELSTLGREHSYSNLQGLGTKEGERLHTVVPNMLQSIVENGQGHLILPGKVEVVEIFDLDQTLKEIRRRARKSINGLSHDTDRRVKMPDLLLKTENGKGIIVEISRKIDPRMVSTKVRQTRSRDLVNFCFACGENPYDFFGIKKFANTPFIITYYLVRVDSKQIQSPYPLSNKKPFTHLIYRYSQDNVPPACVLLCNSQILEN